MGRKKSKLKELISEIETEVAVAERELATKKYVLAALKKKDEEK